jgi:hypothetical protein
MKKGSLIICYKARKRAGSCLDQKEIRQRREWHKGRGDKERWKL